MRPTFGRPLLPGILSELAAVEDTSFLLFLHSLLRYAVLAAVAGAAVVAWRGVVLRSPIMVWERMLTIVAVVLCHVQLLVGLIVYFMRFNAISTKMTGAHQRFWKFEHVGLMVVAIALVTLGRVLSKRARFEGAKQLHVALFFTIGLLIMFWAIPWPFTALGEGRGWL